MVVDNTQESVTVHHKLEIETPSKTMHDVNEVITKASCSKYYKTTHKEINQVYVKDIKDVCDKIDNVSLNVSDFGNVLSSIRKINEQFDSNKTVNSSVNTKAYSLENTCLEPLNVKKLNNCKEFERSMRVLHALSQEANEAFAKFMNSLCAASSFDKKVKMMRWSSFSLCKNPYDIDGTFYNLFLIEFVVVNSRNHVNMHQSPLL